MVNCCGGGAERAAGWEGVACWTGWLEMPLGTRLWARCISLCGCLKEVYRVSERKFHSKPKLYSFPLMRRSAGSDAGDKESSFQVFSAVACSCFSVKTCAVVLGHGVSEHC